MRLRDRVRSLARHASDYFELSGSHEAIIVVLLLALLVALKLLNIGFYKFETDESQHLHVVWGWANGFVQYRDVCDNHMPLFQLLCAPIYKLIGDRATALHWMRLVLLPVSLVAAWATYRIGALCFSKRVGLWAVLLAGFYPGYHFCALEFRTDNLWAPLWLVTLVVLLSGAITLRRAAVAGLLLGLCFGVSMKTTLLLFSILVSGALVLFFVGREKLSVSRAHLVRCVALFLFCALIVPAAIMGAFALGGVWPEFQYWVFENNVLPGFRNHPAWWIYIFPVVFPFVIYAGRKLVRATPDPAVGARRGFLFFICGFFIPALWSFWPLVSRQDYLPYHPLAFVLYAGAFVGICRRLVPARRPFALLTTAVAIEFLISLVFHDALSAKLLQGRTRMPAFWKDGSKEETDLMRATLQLTEPGDFVIDEKGETVFRQRCFKPIWEPCVMERIRRGLMVDDAAERCVATRTCVAVLGRDISADATRFILRNYLPVGNRLRVAGAWLQPSLASEQQSDFDVVIPASYKIIAQAQPVTGTLDGTPYDGARFLEPGPHSFVQTSHETKLALIWAQAADRHFTPF